MKIFWFMTLHRKFWFVQKYFFVRFDKVDGFIRVYDGTRYLVLLDPEKYEVFYNGIICLISQKSVITFFSSRNYGKVKIDSFDSLPLEKKGFL